MTDRPPAVWMLFLPPPGWQSGSWLPYKRGLVSLMTATDAGFETWTHVLPANTEPEAERATRRPDEGRGTTILCFRVLRLDADFYGLTLHVVDSDHHWRMVRLEPRAGTPLPEVPESAMGNYFGESKN